MYFAGRRCVCACECVGVQNLLMSLLLLLFGRVFICFLCATRTATTTTTTTFFKIIFLVVLLSLMLLVSPLSAAL